MSLVDKAEDTGADSLKYFRNSSVAELWGLDEFLKSLDVGLSWMTHLCNTAWEWQTRVVVPLFKKADWRMCLCGRCYGSMGLEAKRAEQELGSFAGSRSDLIPTHV